MKPQSKIEVLPNGTLLELIKVEGGKFMMGSNRDSSTKPIHEVQIQNFYIGKYPITNQQYLPFLQEMENQEKEGRRWVNLDGKYERVRCGIKKQESIFYCVNGLEHHPMIFVNWYGAKAYCKWLSKKTDHTYRLPSESEWEYAARGGRYNQELIYSGSNKLKEIGWFDLNSHREIKPVGLKLPNKLGLYDMSGNVWEWCADYWHDNYKGAPKDGSTWLKGEEKDLPVIRGGSWDISCNYCSIGDRGNWDKDVEELNIGFRIARD